MNITEIISNQRIRLSEMQMEFNEILNRELRRLDELKIVLMKNSIEKPPLKIEEIEPIDSGLITKKEG